MSRADDNMRAFLKSLAERDPNYLGVPLPPSSVRNAAVTKCYISGKHMKVGHRKKYRLTAAGRAFMEGN